MEDNKQPKPNPQPDNKPKEEPKRVTIDLFGGKSKEQLKKEAQEAQQDFGAAGVDDINKNLGSFTNNVNEADTSTPTEIKLDVDAKVIEKASKEKIDFERFSKTKKDFSQSKTKFGEKVGLLLRSKKGLKNTWILEMVAMFLFMALSITIVAIFTKFTNKDWLSKHTDGPLNDPQVANCLKAGLVFHWISIFPCVVPLVYLLTTWFIGINEVHASKMYHYFFWIALGVSALTFVVGFVVILYPMLEICSFPAYWQDETDSLVRLFIK